MSPTN